jgi:hypothetical protein
VLTVVSVDVLQLFRAEGRIRRGVTIASFTVNSIPSAIGTFRRHPLSIPFCLLYETAKRRNGETPQQKKETESPYSNLLPQAVEAKMSGGLPMNEYQELLKEMGMLPSLSSSSKSGGGSSTPPTSQTTASTRTQPSALATPPSTTASDAMQMQVTLRLEERWERVAANVAVKLLDLGRELVDCAKIVAYAAAATLVLYGTAKVIRALKSRGANNDNY